MSGVQTDGACYSGDGHVPCSSLAKEKGSGAPKNHNEVEVVAAFPSDRCTRRARRCGRCMCGTLDGFLCCRICLSLGHRGRPMKRFQPYVRELELLADEAVADAGGQRSARLRSMQHLTGSLIEHYGGLSLLGRSDGAALFFIWNPPLRRGIGASALILVCEFPDPRSRPWGR